MRTGIAALGQDPRRDEAIAAVVSRTGDHDDARPERMTGHRIGHGPPGLFHECDARRFPRRS